MSQHVYFTIPRGGCRIGGCALKDIFQEFFRSPFLIDSNNKARFMIYFQALSDAGIDGAQDLLDAMQKYEEIEIYIG